MEGFRACHGCLKILPKTAEFFHRKNGEQLNSKCKPCAAVKARAHKLTLKADPERYCSKLCTSVRSRAKEVGVDFNLTGKYLFKLLNEQENLCYYTKRVLDFSVEGEVKTTPHRDLPSLDRLIPEKGYVEGNVAWCLFYVNRMKNDLSEKEFIELCKTVIKNTGE